MALLPDGQVLIAGGTNFANHRITFLAGAELCTLQSRPYRIRHRAGGPPQHRFLSGEEAFGVAVQFRREHPRRLRLISTILGWGDLRDDAAVRGFVRAHPFVAFRPATASPA